jgi:hypothetical protein
MNRFKTRALALTPSVRMQDPRDRAFDVDEVDPVALPEDWNVPDARLVPLEVVGHGNKMDTHLRGHAADPIVQGVGRRSHERELVLGQDSRQHGGTRERREG